MNVLDATKLRSRAARCTKGFSMAVQVETSRFGSLRLQSRDTLCFPAGLPGFEDCCGWVLLSQQSASLVGWLQSTDWPKLALPVVDPRKVVSDYRLSVEAREMATLGFDEAEDVQVLAIVSHVDEILTVNLKAPLLINMRRRLGRQVIQTGNWSIHHILTTPAFLKKGA